MPTLGLSNVLQLAGIQLTAMHQTLSHFLEFSEKSTRTTANASSDTSLNFEYSGPRLVASSETELVVELLSIAESDPAIIASLISFYGYRAVPGLGWASAFTVPGLRVVGMTLATEQVAKYVAPQNRAALEANRKKAHLHGMLAQELARTLGNVDPVQAKVCAVLAGLPYLLCESEVENDCAGLAADLLSEWGLPRSLGDVVRYQGVDLSTLEDASELIRLVAFAGKLVPYVSGPDLIDSQFLIELNKLIEIDEEPLYDVIGKAGVNFDDKERQLEKNPVSEDGTQQLQGSSYVPSPTTRLMRQVSDNAINATLRQFLLSPASMLENSVPIVHANRANQDQQVRKKNKHGGGSESDVQTGPVLDKRILDVARYLFGITAICHFSPSSDADTMDSVVMLLGQVAVGVTDLSLRPETIEINTASANSLVAMAYRKQEVINARAEDIVTISELQIAERLGGSGFVCIPLSWDAGVLVCELSSGEPGELVDGPIEASPQFPFSTTTFSRSISSRDSLLSGFVSVIVARYRNDLAIKRASQRLDVDYVKRRVSEVTHEVNNPLAVVQNYLRTLSLKLDDDAPVQSDIETISEEILRVSKIVRKYSEIGRKEDLLTEEVNVNQVLVKLLDVFKGGHGCVEFQTNFDSTMPSISLASDSLKQVIVNLVKNAIEALAGQSEQLMTIETHADVNFGGTSYVEIMLSDNGPGIAPRIRENLFRPNNSSKSGGHSGLGLSIVNRLVEDMGGMVSCRSQTRSEGTPGTVFHLLLPR